MKFVKDYRGLILPLVFPGSTLPALRRHVPANSFKTSNVLMPRLAGSPPYTTRF